MGDFMEDSIAAVKFGFSWLGDSKVWYYVAVLFILQAIVFLAVAGYTKSLFPSFYKSAAGPGAKTVADLLAFSGYSSVQSLLLAFAKLVVVSVALYSLWWLLAEYVSAFVWARALGGKGLSVIALDFNSALRFVGLSVLSIVVMFFNWFDKRLLALPFAIILLFIAGIFSLPFGALFILLAFVLLVLYFFVIIYNSMRFSQASPAFINERLSVWQALEVSWKLTDGRVLSILGRMIVSSLVVVVALALVFIIPGVLVFALERLGYAGLAVVSRSLFNSLSGALSTVALVFAYASIYCNVLEKAGLLQQKLGAAVQPSAPVKRPAARKRSLKK